MAPPGTSAALFIADRIHDINAAVYHLDWNVNGRKLNSLVRLDGGWGRSTVAEIFAD
ncbi:hypothetical protein HanHA89_Chr11g0445771 [Helianthus annuus]|nr:hypothetical protein HanHA89_Chr11g0445771 [Helianthus annuus]